MYKYKKINRSLVIFLLVTFLFLPFSRPQKANAFFAPAIPIISELAPYIGAIILAAAGAIFADEQMSKYEGKKYIEEYGDEVEFYVDRIGDFKDGWVKGKDMVESDWTFWDGRFYVPESLQSSVEEYAPTIPTVPTEDLKIVNSLTFSGKTLHNYTFKLLNINSISFVDVNDSTNKVTFQFDSQQREKLASYLNNYTSIKIETGWAPAGYIVHSTITPLGYIGSVRNDKLDGKEVRFEGFELYKNVSYEYTPSVSAGISKDTLAEKLPADTSVDISNVKDFPLSIPNDIATDVPGAGVVENDTSIPNAGTGEDVITGWKWLDDILNAILDAILSIPVAIKDGISSLIVPAEFIDVDFTPLYIGLSDKFPFSIPWDIKNIITTLDADPQPPIFDLRWNGEEFKLDLTTFDNLFGICRVFTLLSFVVALAIKTRDIIKG